jgi:hypothetical protein
MAINVAGGEDEYCCSRGGGYIAANNKKFMTRQQVLDLYFMDARHKLIDLAAFLDRVDRAGGPEDFRIEALRNALQELNTQTPDRAARVLLKLSDPTTEPIATATTKAASGAWQQSRSTLNHHPSTI